MPPKSTSVGSTGRKTTSSIAQSFKPAGKKNLAASAQQSAKQQSLSRSNSLTKIKQPTLSAAAANKTSTSREASPEKRLQESTNKLAKEQVDKASQLPPLNVDDNQWNAIWKITQKDKLGKVGAIHAEGQNRIHHILRAFDLDPSYGPNLGMSRLERWQRAKNLGEDPPDEVLDILMTKEGQLLDEYRESCLTVMGV